MSESEEDLTIPRAAMNKMIKEILPSIRVANDSRELILNCCTEFIHLISSEANEICNQQTKKTISPEHVLQALEKLGFHDFKEEAAAVMEDCKQIASKRRRQSTRLEHLGIPEEELLRQQQELFAKAREEQAMQEQQQWQMMQFASQVASFQNSVASSAGAGTTAGTSGAGACPPGTAASSSVVTKPEDQDEDSDEY